MGRIMLLRHLLKGIKWQETGESPLLETGNSLQFWAFLSHNHLIDYNLDVNFPSSLSQSDSECICVPTSFQHHNCRSIGHQ